MTAEKLGPPTKKCSICGVTIERPVKGKYSTNMEWSRRLYCGTACVYEGNKRMAWKRRACGDGA